MNHVYRGTVKGRQNNRASIFIEAKLLHVIQSQSVCVDGSAFNLCFLIHYWSADQRFFLCQLPMVSLEKPATFLVGQVQGKDPDCRHVKLNK